MRHLFYPVLQVLFPLCLSYCAADQIKSTYLYKGFDTNGNQVVEGLLNLTVNATNQVRGDWELHKVNSDKTTRLGPQTGTGKLNGQIIEGKVNLDLNPGWADNNVILDGLMTSTNITGTWGYYGFAGKLSGGTFEAAKK